MAFRKINELDGSKSLIMGLFVITGLVGLSVSITPFMVAWLGATAPVMVATTLLNPVAKLLAMFILPGIYLQVLKLFRVWPMVERPFSWRFSEMMADISAALKSFNDYLPIKKWAIINGFFFAVGTALTLSVSPIIYAALGITTGTFALAILANLALRVAAVLLLPGLYFQALKYWQIWPLKQERTPFSINPKVLYADTIKALRGFDWQILQWVSALFLATAFPQLNKIYEALKPNHNGPASGSWLDKAKWLTREIGLISANFFTTLFSDRTIDKIVAETPKKTSSWLFSLGMRERIHAAFYYYKNQEELNRKPSKEREEALKSESESFILSMFLRADARGRGFFETIHYGITQEWDALPKEDENRREEQPQVRPPA